MFASAQGGGEGIGPTKRGTGVNIMGIVDRQGLPLAVSPHAAHHHDVTLGQRTCDFSMLEAKPEHLIGDKAYDSDKLDEELGPQGLERIAPHRSNRRRLRTQEGRPLRRDQRRWLVERFVSWIQWHRRILMRWESYTHNFLGVVQLACALILLKQF